MPVKRALDVDRVDRIAAAMMSRRDFSPIYVVALPDGKFEMRDGHHRLAAARRLGAVAIPALIVSR